MINIHKMAIPFNEAFLEEQLLPIIFIFIYFINKNCALIPKKTNEIYFVTNVALK